MNYTSPKQSAIIPYFVIGTNLLLSPLCSKTCQTRSLCRVDLYRYIEGSSFDAVDLKVFKLEYIMTGVDVIYKFKESYEIKVSR